MRFSFNCFLDGTQSTSGFIIQAKIVIDLSACSVCLVSSTTLRGDSTLCKLRTLFDTYHISIYKTMYTVYEVLYHITIVSI